MTSYVWLPLAMLYGLALVGLMVYGLHCYLMLALFLSRQRRARAAATAEIAAWRGERPPDELPLVTLQLPVYNERTVVARLLHSVAGLDYPRHRFDVQVLDDSTDGTREVIDQATAALREAGIAVTVLRRAERHHFKAGALAAGLSVARGELVAIFDADFVIPPDFLRRAVPLLEAAADIACVQGRWGHLNRTENWLTQAQSVGIDGHFAAEQGARSYHGLCLNFNGTAGLWRKAAIIAGGGWQGDTLTEDLDLSYRVQLAGYRLRYDFDLECPAEIPNNVLALKSQQQRWAKGSIETACKLLPRLWRSECLGLGQKLEATLHLTHYAVAVLMCLICVLTLPMLLWTPLPRLGWLAGLWWGAILVSALAPCVMYTGSGLVLGRPWFSLSRFPAMLVLGTGLCLNNARAVVEALLGRRSDFVRTPKSGSTSLVHRVGAYQAAAGLRMALLELALGAYCAVTLVVYVGAQKYLFGCFLGAYACGFTVLGLVTLARGLAARRAVATE